jgi:hypothetical protein
VAYTEQDRLRLKRAITSGVLTIINSEGERVTYRTLDELETALARVEAELDGANVEIVQTRRVVLTGRSGF